MPDNELNIEISKRIEELHQKIISIDSHVDTPLFFKYGYDLGKKNTLKINPEDTEKTTDGQLNYEVKVDVPKMKEGLCDAVCMVAYLPQGKRTKTESQKTVGKAVSIIRQIKKQIKDNSEIVAQACSVDDLRKNKAEGKKTILIGIENGYAIGKDIKNVERFARMGVIYITLAHDGDNDICDSSAGNAEHNGLSAFGKKVVREMNRTGIIADISHTSEKTALDVLKTSKLPVIASHSSVKTLCNHPRNVSDKLMKAIAAKGGVIQICLYDNFLKEGGQANVKDAVNHIDYVIRNVGLDHVGIGSDFDGCDNSAGLQGINEFPKITMELLQRGYSDDDIAKIFGGNFMRVMNLNRK